MPSPSDVPSLSPLPPQTNTPNDDDTFNHQPSFTLPIIALVIITILNDGCMITIAYDNVVPEVGGGGGRNRRGGCVPRPPVAHFALLLLPPLPAPAAGEAAEVGPL